MRWEHWIDQYLTRYCTARGLAATSIKTYQDVLTDFSTKMQKLGKSDPMYVDVRDVFKYLDYLKTERGNGQASIFLFLHLR